MCMPEVDGFISRSSTVHHICTDALTPIHQSVSLTWYKGTSVWLPHIIIPDIFLDIY